MGSVEGVEVDRRRLGQLLHPVVADLDPGSACDGVAGLVEGSAGRLGGCKLTQPAQVPLDGQVEHPVGACEHEAKPVLGRRIAPR